MASFQIDVTHPHSRDQATERLRQFSKVALADIPTDVTEVQEQWQSDGSLEFGFKAMGMKLTGRMTVGDGEVKVAGKMPFAALPFRGAIESKIREQLEKALS